MRMKRGEYYYDFLDTVEKLRSEDNSCYICGSTKKVHPHHIRKVPDSDKEYANESNIVLLCDGHHYRFHLKYGSGKEVNHKNFVIFCKKELEKEFERQTELLKFNIMEILKEMNYENETLTLPELENKLSDIIIKYKEKYHWLKQKNDELKINKQVIRQNNELKRENRELIIENKKFQRENKKLKKQNNKLNNKIDIIEIKPGIKQYNELIKENSGLKKENNNLKQQIDELTYEINRLQFKQEHNVEQQTTFLKLNYGGWGIIGKYCRTDERYSKKASRLSEYLKKHIGKNSVKVDSNYVKIVIKKSVSIRKLYEVLLIDDDILYDLEYTDYRKIIYFEWDD